MRVDDQVWCNPCFGERHVFLGCNKSDNSFLSVPGCELVADLRNPQVPCPDFHQAGTVLTFGYDNRINNPVLVTPHGNRCVTPFLDSNQVAGRFFQEPRRRSLPNQDILFSDDRLRVDYPVFIEVFIRVCPMGTGHFLVRYFDPVNLPTGIPAFFSFISPEEM